MHTFEGWFASEDDYQQQRRSGLLQCPVCGSAEVQKLLNAPHLNLQQCRSKEEGTCTTPSTDEAAEPAVCQQQARWLRTMRRAVQQSEDVGERFAEEARKMHAGETPERSIRGKASMQEAQALQEEGIDVLPLPAFLDGDLQ
jgi:hypothetical protein